ncbi:hypothetical protein THRCLA_09750 [Thraustotheca clavata]|uniref:B30.2/SPRY domain-containing protein n=1 Tax=Thraustotheca clavata TaxID=74557 RepID=A0A1V9YV35_9STRA|nr:hypothetical protein THRCLA_09750 [Thraustotheca clavata]
MASLEELPTEVLKLVARYFNARDTKSLSLVSTRLQYVICGDCELWKDLFWRQWTKTNFVLDEKVPLCIAPALLEYAKSEMSAFRLLAHTVRRLPSHATIDPLTNIKVVKHAPGKNYAPLQVYYDGKVLGDDRCVRANAPMTSIPHATIYREIGENGREQYNVNITSHNYFEITIGTKPMINMINLSISRDHCVSIGICSERFQLRGTQPGWRSNSYGYHGDDGRFFHQKAQGESFGPTFSAGDTVGCAVLHSIHCPSYLIFTINGTVVGQPRPCDMNMYPVIGIDSPYAVEFNFGQTPFRYPKMDVLYADFRGIIQRTTNPIVWDDGCDLHNDDDDYDFSMEDSDLDSVWSTQSEVSSSSDEDEY